MSKHGHDCAIQVENESRGVLGLMDKMFSAAGRLHDHAASKTVVVIPPRILQMTGQENYEAAALARIRERRTHRRSASDHDVHRRFLCFEANIHPAEILTDKLAIPQSQET
jgi:hypothetical protein